MASALAPRVENGQSINGPRLASPDKTSRIPSYIISIALATVGFFLYVCSLAWPLLSRNPSWMAYIPAAGGVAAILLSVRGIKSKGYPSARRF